MRVAGVGEGSCRAKRGKKGESQSVRSDDLDVIRLQGRAGVGVHVGGNSSGGGRWSQLTGSAAMTEKS